VKGIAASTVEGIVGSFIAKNRAPFVCKIIGIFRVLEQSIDGLLAFCRIGIGQKRTAFIKRWNASNNVE